MSKDVNASTPSGNESGKVLDPLELAEKRRKDAQAALTPLQQENARLKAELAAAKSQPTTVMTPEKQQELDDLMNTDPVKWRLEMNRIESETKTATDEQLKELTKIELDKEYTRSFFEANPDIDKDVVKQIIPTTIQKQYEAGEITVGEMLEIGKKLLDGAPVASVIAPNSPKIGDVAGSDKPSNNSKQKQVEVDWATAQI